MASVVAQLNQIEDRIISFIHTAAVTVGTPIYVTGIGPLIPIVSADADTETSYYKGVRIKCDIISGDTVAKADRVWYDTANDGVTDSAPDAGFPLGVAVEAGTGTAGTVVVDMDDGVNASTVAATLTTVGGAAAESITFNGVNTNDVIFVSGVTTNGVLAYSCVTPNFLFVTFSGDPSTTTQIAASVQRATQ